MSALAKIKKQAAQHEHDRQYDKALALYTRLLEEPDPDDDEIDVALFNRAGDVALRAGDLPRAVAYYERALDLYATGGFLNNAIALGAKILRQAPDRVATHYTLGVLHAKKGFRSDARQHFLTYAERMQRAGQGSEAARSLADYVALCDGAIDARAGLSAHLATGAPRAGDLAAPLHDLLEQGLRAAGRWDGGPQPGADEPQEVPATRTEARPLPAHAADLVFLDLGGVALAPDAVPDARPIDAAPLELASAVELEPLAAQAWDPAPALDLVLDLADADAEGAAVPARDGSPLDRLPGELPPLAPSMVALDGGAGAWEDERADALSSDAGGTALDDVGATAGVPLFVEEEAGQWGASSMALPLLEPMDGPFEAPGVERYPVLEFDGALELTMDAPLPPATDRAVDPVVPSVADLPLLEEMPELASADLPLLDLELPDVQRDVEPDVEPEAATPEVPAPLQLAAEPAAEPGGLDLGAWLRETEPARSTRLVAPVIPTTGDEQADFRATLDAFRVGVARNLEDADFDAHYDLGVAYKEMGLLEEAIGEFQKAARAPEGSLRALEALATCFLERGEPELVLSTLVPAIGGLDRAAVSAAEAPQHVALCYLLGAASQEVGRTDDARAWFLRVLATDYAFRDAASRLASLSPPPR